MGIKNKNKNRGFLKIIGVFVIFAGTLAYFGIDVRGFVDTHPEIKNFFAVSKQVSVSLYENYFTPAAAYFLTDTWGDLHTVWEKAKSFLSI